MEETPSGVAQESKINGGSGDRTHDMQRAGLPSKFPFTQDLGDLLCHALYVFTGLRYKEKKAFAP